MKKFLALMLACLFVLSMSTVSLAETYTTTTETTPYEEEIGINATVSENGGESIPVISVDISHGRMVFVYVAENSTGLWDPSTHSYGENFTEAQWVAVDNSNTITVTNHSNSVIGAFISTEMVEGDVVATATPDSEDLPWIISAVGTAVDEAPSVTWTVTLEGDPTTTMENKLGVGTDGSLIGTITVSINGAPA